MGKPRVPTRTRRGPSVGGTDAGGRAVRREWGWLGAENRGERRLSVRRVTRVRPGDEDVAVVTGLTRRQIEGAFQRVTEVFRLQRLVGGRPPATAFQASPCPVPFNVSTGAGAIAAGRPEPTPDAVSGEQVFADRTKELIG